MQRKSHMMLMSAILMATFLGQSALAQEEVCCGSACCDATGELKKNEQEICPVMGDSVNKEIYVDYDGKRIYFCCASCVDTFKKAPEKYMKKLETEGVVLEDAPVGQEICPVMGNPIDKEVYKDYQGKQVDFCCHSCIEAFKQDPEKYMEKMKDQGAGLENVLIEQKACPVSGKPVNKEVYTDYEGERIYFCCAGCLKAFEKNPKKYLEKI